MKVESSSHGMSRRLFLQAGTLASLGMVTQRSFAQTEPAEPPIRPIDAHVHIWNTDRERYPLADGYHTEGLNPQSFTVQDLFHESKPVGVDRIVLIQMNFYKYDNSYMLDEIRNHPENFRGVAIIDESLTDTPERMRTLLSQGVTGFRLYAEKDNVIGWHHSPEMHRMWEVASETKQAICLLSNPDSIPAIATLCELHPSTRVVIDHFSRIGVDGEIRESDLAELCALAKFPNVFIKVSAFYALGKKKSPYTDLSEMIRRLRDTFGAERLMWASDAPFQVVDGHHYRDSLRLVQEKLDFLSSSEKRCILQGTAEEIYWFPTQS